jgi:hypothetical protein
LPKAAGFDQVDVTQVDGDMYNNDYVARASRRMAESSPTCSPDRRRPPTPAPRTPVNRRL